MEENKDTEEVIFPSIVNSVVNVPKNRGRLEHEKPKECAYALELIAQGYGVQKVTEKTGLSLGQIASLRERHEVAIKEHRKRFAEDGVELAEKVRLVALEKLERLLEDPKALKYTNVKDLLASYALLQEKVFSALGENVITIEHKKGYSLEDAAKAIAEARAKIVHSSINVEAKEVGDGMEEA